MRKWLNHVGQNIKDFHDLIQRSRIEKIDAIEKVKRLRKLMPVLKKQSKVELEYYKNMEPYEMESRKVLKNRIKRILMVSQKPKNDQKIDPNELYRGTKRRLS